MCKRLFLCLLLVMTSACAGFDRPFAAPADAALTRAVMEAVAEYPDVVPTAVGGRVYLEGWVVDFSERQTVLSRVGALPGVKNIVNNLRLTEPGSDHDRDQCRP